MEQKQFDQVTHFIDSRVTTRSRFKQIEINGGKGGGKENKRTGTGLPIKTTHSFKVWLDFNKYLLYIKNAFDIVIEY